MLPLKINTKIIQIMVHWSHVFTFFLQKNVSFIKITQPILLIKKYKNFKIYFWYLGLGSYRIMLIDISIWRIKEYLILFQKQKMVQM